MIKPKDYLKFDEKVSVEVEKLEDGILNLHIKKLIQYVKQEKVSGFDSDVKARTKKEVKKSQEKLHNFIVKEVRKSAINNEKLAKEKNDKKSVDNIRKAEMKIINAMIKQNINSYLINGEKEFKKVLDKTLKDIALGKITKEKAIDIAVRKYAKSSDGFVVSPSGRKERLEVVIKRHYRTALAKIDGKITLEYMRRHSLDLVRTTSHHDARLSHQAWQGKIFSLTGKKYPNFYTATRYGHIDGLCGINCRHSFFPYLKGVKYDDEKNEVSKIHNDIEKALSNLKSKRRSLTKTKNVLENNKRNANAENHQLKLLEIKERVIREKLSNAYNFEDFKRDIKNNFNLIQSMDRSKIESLFKEKYFIGTFPQLDNRYKNSKVYLNNHVISYNLTKHANQYPLEYYLNIKNVLENPEAVIQTTKYEIVMYCKLDSKNCLELGLKKDGNSFIVHLGKRDNKRIKNKIKKSLIKYVDNF